MKIKSLSLVLVLALVLSLFSGCGDAVGKIAGNVADAALKELENQIKLTLEENKLEVKELKTAYGNLNGDGKNQFFCAALVKSEATAIPQAAADTLAKVFDAAGLTEQTESQVESPYLVHKTITFKHSDFSGGTYYLIYAYQEDLSATMPKLTE